LCRPLELATADGGVTTTAATVELACSDNVRNLPPPEDGFPDSCGLRASFDAPVEVDSARLPAGATGPFVARVYAASNQAMHASVIGAGVDPGATTGAETGQGADTTASGAILATTR
jgi:hypothetical protein